MKGFQMKSLILVLLLSLFPLSALADLEGAPYIPEIDARFNAVEQGNHFKTTCGSVGGVGSCDGHWARQLVSATYDFSTLTGSSTLNAGIYNLGVSIPANSIITESALYSGIKPSSVNSATLGFYCQNSADIITDTLYSSYGAAGVAINGSSSGATVGNFKYITAKCDVHAKIATGNLIAGRVTAFVEYWTHH